MVKKRKMGAEEQQMPAKQEGIDLLSKESLVRCVFSNFSIYVKYAILK